MSTWDKQRNRNDKGNRIRDTFQYIKRHFFKYIPIIGLAILFFMASQEPNSNQNPKNLSTITDQIKDIFNNFIQSFDFSDSTKLIKTVVIIITIWTGYKYWLINFRIIGRNKKLVDKVIFVVLLLVFSSHIKMKSGFGEYFDYAIFLLALYLVLAVTWLLIKIIDSFNLESDLYCWGLRLLGGGLILFGYMLLFAGGMAKAVSNSPLVFDNIFWISGLCIMALGGFSEFRSFRRYGVFVYMR